MGWVWSENRYYGTGDATPGLMKETYDALGNRTTYAYYAASDSNGRFGDIKEIIQEQKESDGSYTTLASTTYKYDPTSGNRKAEIRRKKNTSGVWFDFATTQFEYDARNRLVKTI